MPQKPKPIPVPEPIDLMLPQRISISPLTSANVIGEHGGVTGIDVRIEALDAWGDSTKAMGKFRFEMHHYVGSNRDPRGGRIAVWNVDIENAKDNRRYWVSTERKYHFKLGWHDPIPLGNKFVLAAYFESSFGPRLLDEKVLLAGE